MREYQCPSCGHKQWTSGGKDKGRLISVETYLCTECLLLTDVLTEERGNYPGGPAVIPPENYSCTECGGHSLEPWDPDLRTCPKCGMTMNAEGPEIMWD